MAELFLNNTKMKELITGRVNEQEVLENLYKSHQSEFVVIYGRRRVGKTFLVRELFENRFAFYHTALSPFEMENGQAELLIKQQLMVFGNSLRDFGDYHDMPPKDWFQAFNWLKDLLSGMSKRKRLVVFIDELPWMDTPRSGFITAFEHFWNSWGAGKHNLLLIVCGSASSWINDKLINNTSGLYGRTTMEIHLSPFSLSDCKNYFESRKINIADYDILQAYMIMGGIPYYLSYIDKRKSLAQNIDNLFFNDKGKLSLEFNRLFKSLFVNPQQYVDILRLLSKRKAGYTRKEITESINKTSGGGLTSILQTLEACDFIKRYIPFGSSSRNTHYKLTDLFCLFYFHFVDSAVSSNSSFWQNNLRSPALNAWRGFAFEEVCFIHQNKIKQALGISGVHSEVSMWRNNDSEDHTQIDMVIDRADHVVNLCELKFYSDDLEIDKSYDKVLNHKVEVFLKKTKTKKAPHLTIITTNGLRQNKYSGRVNNVVTMDMLF